MHTYTYKSYVQLCTAQHQPVHANSSSREQKQMPTSAALHPLSTMLQKGVRLSHETKDLSCRSVNMVHVKRPHLAVQQQPARLLAKPSLQVNRG